MQFISFIASCDVASSLLIDPLKLRHVKQLYIRRQELIIKSYLKVLFASTALYS